LTAHQVKPLQKPLDPSSSPSYSVKMNDECPAERYQKAYNFLLGKANETLKQNLLEKKDNGEINQFIKDVIELAESDSKF
jgi:hypothetical protein